MKGISVHFEMAFLKNIKKELVKIFKEE